MTRDSIPRHSSSPGFFLTGTDTPLVPGSLIVEKTGPDRTATSSDKVLFYRDNSGGLVFDKVEYTNRKAKLLAATAEPVKVDRMTKSDRMFMIGCGLVLVGMAVAAYIGS